MNSFEDLNAWKISFNLVKDIYVLTSRLPATERYGLCSQMQRAAVSIPSNIAEGQQRKSRNEFINFLSIARGSAAELYTQVLLCKELYEIEVGSLLDKIIDVQKINVWLTEKT